jgi:uncharacterized membrane protein
MRTDWEYHLNRWAEAGLVDATAAAGIRQWETAQAPPRGLRWPVLLALAFGALMLGSGALLFVSAHWDELDPGGRMALLLAMLAVFHAGGAAAGGRFEGLSVALHFIGTVALGAAIAMTGQIFHISEHWPSAVLMWAVGAGIAWIALRHWTQAALAAVLVPWWLAGEWSMHAAEAGSYYIAPVAAGICALSLTYLSLRRNSGDTPLRTALAWIGGIALLPASIVTAAGDWKQVLPSFSSCGIAWCMAAVLPLGLALAVRRRAAVWNVAAVLWTLMLAALAYRHGANVAVYAWCALGAIGLAWWGLRESRPERINLAMAGFAITLGAFYFSSVMDKLGRSASLMVLGLLFLGGGWALERARRRLIAHIRPEVS